MTILVILGWIVAFYIGATIAIILAVVVVGGPFYILFMIGKVFWIVGGLFVKTSPGKIKV